MKLFSFLLSVITFIVTAYFLITDFPDTTDSDGLIYLFLMVILVMICITGIIINRPVVSRVHHRYRLVN